MAIVHCKECGQEVSTFAKICPNCGCPNVNNEPPTEPQEKTVVEPFGKVLLRALLHFLYRLVYFFFILPFDLWKKAVYRMYAQKTSKSLDADRIKHEVPFFVWLKRYTFDFLIDGLIIISWLLILVVFVAFFANIEGNGRHFVERLLLSIYGIYWLPVFISLIRDTLTIFIIMPVRWIFSFLRRPAKTYDFTHSAIEKKKE